MISLEPRKVAITVTVNKQAQSLEFQSNSSHRSGRIVNPRCLLSSRLLSRNVKFKIYKTIILSVVLYGSETWSLTLRVEHKPRLFENRVLRRIFGPKRDAVTGEWRWLHSEELHIL
jgi:hypothetical protein